MAQMPFPPSPRKKNLEPDPVDPRGEDDEEDEQLPPKGGKENPLKRWAAAKVGGAVQR